MRPEIIDIRTVASSDMGSLSFFESGVDVDFPIKRIYYIYDVPEGGERGGHAHRALSQVLFCPAGRVDVVLDNGEDRITVSLDNPGKAVVIRPMVWRETLWIEPGSVLISAASDLYSESDYIRNYDSFLEEVKRQK